MPLLTRGSGVGGLVVLGSDWGGVHKPKCNFNSHNAVPPVLSQRSLGFWQCPLTSSSGSILSHCRSLLLPFLATSPSLALMSPSRPNSDNPCVQRSLSIYNVLSHLPLFILPHSHSPYQLHIQLLNAVQQVFPIHCCFNSRSISVGYCCQSHAPLREGESLATPRIPRALAIACENPTERYRKDDGRDGEGGRKFSLGIQEVSGAQNLR
jgi:hypothetical protein